MKEEILVCIGATPTAPKVIDAASRMAQTSQAQLHALFVETPDFQRGGRDLHRLLDQNMEYAKKAGAVTETVCGDDIVYQIEEYAKIMNITTIVIGNSPGTETGLFRRASIAQRIYAEMPNVNVLVVPLDVSGTLSYRSRKSLRARRPGIRDILVTVAAPVIATIVGHLFVFANMGDSNIIPLYILAVMAVAVATASHLCGILSSLLSVFIFNFFFTEPRFSLRAYDTQYWITFLVMFFSSILISSLMTRLKDYANRASENSFRMSILLNTNQMLQQARSTSAIAALTARQLNKLLNCTVMVCLAKDGKLQEPKIYAPAGVSADRERWTQIDQEAVQWAWINRRQDGYGTSIYPSANMMYLPIKIRDHAYGVFGIDQKNCDMDTFLFSLISSILEECALAMENEKNERDKEEASQAARNQKLRADLLRSISHDLRTPLTSISGNASLLLSGETLTADDEKRIYNDIYDDSMWLIGVVQNLLAVTRLESGEVSLNLKSELMDEVITEALRHIDRKSEEHEIRTEFSDDILLAKMDAGLMVQVIVNLVNNAIKYTQKGSHITVSAFLKNDRICVKTADDGPGISPEAKEHIFEMFWTSSSENAPDSRRSMGLGLPLCRSIVEAHGGAITVCDNQPQGTVIEFWLPAEKVVENG